MSGCINYKRQKQGENKRFNMGNIPLNWEHIKNSLINNIINVFLYKYKFTRTFYQYFHLYWQFKSPYQQNKSIAQDHTHSIQSRNLTFCVAAAVTICAPASDGGFPANENWKDTWRPKLGFLLGETRVILLWRGRVFRRVNNPNNRNR